MARLVSIFSRFVILIPTVPSSYMMISRHGAPVSRRLPFMLPPPCIILSHRPTSLLKHALPGLKTLQHNYWSSPSSCAMELMQMYVLPIVREHATDNIPQGKTRNFAHPALREVIITFFYTGMYRVAGKRPDVFKKQLPLTFLALVGAAVYFCHLRTCAMKTDLFLSFTASSMVLYRMVVGNHSRSSLLRSTVLYTAPC